MPVKHKRHMRLSNGYGNISYLGKNRRRPYAVYPPITKSDADGNPIRSKAIGYAETYNEAMEMLVMYHKGFTLPDVQLVQKPGPTFAEIYKQYYEDKFEKSGKQLSQSSRNGARTAYKNVSALHDKDFKSLTYPELQAVVDACPLKHASIEMLVSLIKGMYRYAEKMGIIEKDQSKYLTVRIPEDDEHGVPFSESDLALLWLHKADTEAKIILSMIYSGFRISAYKSLLVCLEPDWYFQGGVKTKASKDRIVPIHSGIRKIVSELIEEQGCIIKVSGTTFRVWMKNYLQSIGIMEPHTPHDCRHTFSMLCEKYEVPENDRKRLLGHAFSDITNSVYGHRDLESLRASIEKIKIP